MQMYQLDITTCKCACHMQEVPQPEVPPATAEDQILLVRHLRCSWLPDVSGTGATGMMVGVCLQQHWRSLTNAFRTSCYRIDPKAEKRECRPPALPKLHAPA